VCLWLDHKLTRIRLHSYSREHENERSETKHISSAPCENLVPTEIPRSSEAGLWHSIDRWINEQLRERVRVRSPNHAPCSVGLSNHATSTCCSTNTSADAAITRPSCGRSLCWSYGNVSLLTRRAASGSASILIRAWLRWWLNLKPNILHMIDSFEQGGSGAPGASSLCGSAQERTLPRAARVFAEQRIVARRSSRLNLGEIPEYPLTSFFMIGNFVTQLRRLARFLKRERD